MNVEFEIIGKIQNIETMAIGLRIRILPYLQKAYGRGRWRKLKDIVQAKFLNGRVWQAKLHWYEAHGIDRKNMKIKWYLD